MRIFVTGSSGFIGKAFCKAAIAQGHEVLGLSRDPSEIPNHVKGSLAEIPWKEIEAFRPEAAMHLAWIVLPGAWMTSPLNQTLAQQSADLFRGLITRGVKHIAAAGSCAEYLTSDDPLSEESPSTDAPLPYAQAKLQTLQHLREECDQAGVAWSWLRIFYCYGEGEHPNRIASSLMRDLMAGQPVEIKTPDSIKDYVHIQDTVSALLWSLEKPLRGVVNIGTGVGIRILDLATQIAETVDADASLVSRAKVPLKDPMPVTISNISHICESGWHPQVSLKDGLQRLHASLRGSHAVASPEVPPVHPQTKQPKRILVTGATGFIGREFCRLALQHGHAVLGLCRNPNADLHSGCEMAIGSMEQFPWSKVDEFHPDTVLHLAWTAVPGTNYLSSENEHLLNQSTEMFRGLIQRGVRHIAAVGSAIEYAPSVAPMREDSPLSDRLPYTLAKIETHRQLVKLAAGTNTLTSWLRIFNTYGEGEHKSRFASSVMLKLMRGEAAVLSTPTSLRDFTHVADTAVALLTCLENGVTGTINIGSGEGVLIRDLAVAVADALGVTRTMVQDAKPPNEDLLPVAVADVTRLRSTGWRPKVSLTQGLQRLRGSLQP